MDRAESRDSLAPYLFAGSLVLGILIAADARAQSSEKGRSAPLPDLANARRNHQLSRTVERLNREAR